MTTDHINHTSIKLTRAVNALFSFTKDAYQSEFGDDRSQQREFCRRVAEKYAAMIDCKVVDADFEDAAKQAFSALVGSHAARESVQGIARERLGAALGYRNKSKPATQADNLKKLQSIATANPPVTKAIELAEQIIELADSPDLPPAAIDYAESVATKARSIAERIESENMATSGQITALENMLDGLQRWFQYVE